MRKLLKYLSSLRYVGCYVALVGVVLSAAVSFGVYPKVAVVADAPVDPDNFGDLGFGLWKNGTLSAYPDDQPTIRRGPVYPAFVAALLMATNGWYPYSVQAAQCVLFGLTCLMVFWISKTLWNANVALLASGVCAFHPFLIWYTSRIWVETLTTFLFTALFASALYLSLRPTKLRTVVVGCILGISVLSKATFLPFIVIVPLLLGWVKDRKIGWRLAWGTLPVALVIVFPWTVRNWNLTGKLIPVHLGAGYTCYIGDSVVETWTQSPFSHIDHFHIGHKKALSLMEPSITGELKRWETEVLSESILRKDCIARYVEDPWFFVRKLALNSWRFWIIGGTTPKTALISIVQIPLLVFFMLSTIRTLKQKRLRTIQGTMLSLVWLYFLFHLPVLAKARLSLPLVPTMLICVFGLLESALNGGERST